MEHKTDWADGDIVKPEDFNRIEGNIKNLKTELGDQTLIQEMLSTKAEKENPVFVNSISMGRRSDSIIGENSVATGTLALASGDYSHAEGECTIAEGCGAHSEGKITQANGDYSHAEGQASQANGTYAHAEGESTIAKGYSAHSEGYSTTANGQHSHAEGSHTIAKGSYSHAEGRDAQANGGYSHAEGHASQANFDYAHAEGECTIAEGRGAHSEGYFTTASGDYAHAEGDNTKAKGRDAHAEGYYTTALDNQHAEGHYNDFNIAASNDSSGTSPGTAFVIGNGTYDSLSNAFRITGEGKTFAKGAYSATGADYAEFAEWADGNPDNEDRRGYFVTFDEEKPNMIRKANSGEYVLGIISGNPCVIGNSDESWLGRYVFDDFGAFVYEERENEVEYIDEETGETKTRLEKIKFYKENPNYNPEEKYIHREFRKEWDYVGWIGVLSVWDDNSCIPGGYCTVADGGIATVSERGTDTYRVLERVNANIIKVALK